MIRMVSVCMITYNHAPYIEQAIRSVMAQQGDFTLELIVSDDASTDGTPGIIARLAAEYPEVMLPLRNGPNVGMMRNFIRALNACSGDYVALLEGDDYWCDDQKLQKQIAALETGPRFGACFHRTEWHNDAGERIHVFPDFPVPQPLTLRHLLLMRNVMNTSSVVFRRGAHGELPAGFEDLDMGDYPLQVLIARAADIVYVPKVMSVYRVHSDGVWSTLTPAQSDIRFARTFAWLLPHLPPEYQGLGATLNEFVQMLAQLQTGNEKQARWHAWRRAGRRPFGKQTALSLAVLLWPRLARAARNRIHPDSKIHKFFR